MHKLPLRLSGLKETHLDRTLELEDRLDKLVRAVILPEMGQLVNNAPAIAHATVLAYKVSVSIVTPLHHILRSQTPLDTSPRALSRHHTHLDPSACMRFVYHAAFLVHSTHIIALWLFPLCLSLPLSFRGTCLVLCLGALLCAAVKFLSEVGSAGAKLRVESAAHRAVSC